MADQTVAATGAQVTTSTIGDIAPPPKTGHLKWIRLASIITVLVGWELIGRQVNPLFMSYPTAIINSAIRVASTGELGRSFLESTRTLIVGFTMSSCFAVLLGLLIGRYKAVEASTDWLVNALYSTPHLAIIPLVTLWFGLGFQAKLFIVFISVLFPVLINTIAGVRNVPAQLVELGEAFAATERQLFTKVILPSALPYVMTGLRLGVGRGVIAMVVAEFFTAITGLGAMIVKYGNQYDTATMFVPIFVLMLLGITLSMTLRKAETWVAPWKEAEAT